jgi:hypothetical protein
MHLSSNEEKTTAIMKKLVQSEMNDKRFEFMYKMLKMSKLPNILVMTLVMESIAKTKAISEKDPQKGPRVKAVLFFLQKLIKMGKFNLAEIGREIREYCESYRDYDEAVGLTRIMN